MTTHPEPWSITDRFSYEFSGTANHLRKFRNAYCVGAGASVLAVAAITWSRSEASAADLPVIFLASFIHLLRGVAILSLFFAWLGSGFIQDWLYARTSNAWVKGEALRRPGVSFPVPYWRFYLPAVVTRFAIFSIWLGCLFYLLYVVPGRVSELERFIPENFPF